VPDFSVFAERLAVIGGDDDQCGGPLRSERLDETAYLAIRFRHFVVVSRSDGAGSCRGICGISIRRVRLEQVDPQKESFRAMPVEPCNGVVNHDAAGPLVEDVAVGVTRHAIAVRLKALDQSEPAIERKRTHETGRRESFARQSLTERGYFQIEPHPVVAGAVAGGIAPRHQAGVRRQRDRGGREGLRESGAAAREPVQRRRSRGGVPVSADPIGAQCVDGDDEEVTCRRRNRLGRRVFRPRTSGSERTRQQYRPNPRHP
jgi:hypothetical protein